MEDKFEEHIGLHLDSVIQEHNKRLRSIIDDNNKRLCSILEDHNKRFIQCLHLVDSSFKRTRSAPKKDGLWIAGEDALFDLMMCHTNAHLLFESILATSSFDQNASIVACICQCPMRLVQAAKHFEGSNSVKALIKNVNIYPDLYFPIISALSSGLFSIMVDSRGSSLISYFFENLDYHLYQFLLEAALQDCQRLAVDEIGCASLKQCIARSREPYRKYIVDKVIDNCTDLAKCRPGCSVINFILNFHDTDATEKICSNISKNFEELLMDRWGSYAIQKCLISTSGNRLLYDLWYLCDTKLEEIEEHPHASKVLETALKVKKDSVIHDQLVLATGGDFLPNW